MDFHKAAFSLDTIAEIAASLYGMCPPFNIQKLGGIPNDNYLVCSSEEKIVIKVYSKGQSNLPHIEKEIEFLHLFHQQGILVPVFVAGKNKEILQQYNGFFLTATRFIDGTPLSTMPFSEPLLYEVGCLTGRVVEIGHSIDIGTTDARSYKEELDYLMMSAEKYNVEYGFNFDIENAFDIEACYEIAEWFDVQEKHFLHRDIWKHNLILTDTGLALLDFNDWSVGSSHFEICVPLLVFSMPTGSTFIHAYFEALLKGFRTTCNEIFKSEDIIKGLKFVCFLYFLYNLIQSPNRADSEIYIFRNALMNTDAIYSQIQSSLQILEQ